jgi:hypothetical protein
VVPNKEAQGAGNSKGRVPARKHRASCDSSQLILPFLGGWESQLLARRIGQLRTSRALGVAALQAAAGRIIDAHPDCPIRASRLVDRLTVAMDLAQWERRL